MSVQQHEKTQIFVEPRIPNSPKGKELKQSLRDEGVAIGYPFCEVEITSQNHLYRLQQIFEYYGWMLEVRGGFYAAYQNEDEVEV